MQDLNRYYAITTGHYLMTPADALRAIVMLGEKPKAKTITSIVERNHWQITPAEVSDILSINESKQVVGTDVGRGLFKLAFRLLRGLQSENESGLQDLGGTSYEQFLEKIMTEAPGHI